MTYSNPRQHIWSLYASFSEDPTYGCCSTPGSNSIPPTFVDQNYFCDTGSWNWGSELAPLWDSDANCNSGTNCCVPHSVPWFNTTLTDPTTGDIEIRICGDESTQNEDTPLELIEIYVM